MLKIFKVPNTDEGKAFLKLASKYLNKEDYTIAKRGRNPNRAVHAVAQGKRRGAYRQDVPLRFSTTIAVYIRIKNKRNKRIHYGNE